MPTSLYGKTAKEPPSKGIEAPPDSPLAIVVGTLHGVILSWNKMAERLTGYTEGEMVGRNLSILAPRPLAEEEPILHRLRHGDSISRFRTRCRHKLGRVIEFWLAIAPVWDARRRVIGFSASAEEYRQGREREALPKLIEYLPLGMRWVGKDGTILLANHEALDLLGYTRDEYVGHSLSEFHPDAADVETIIDHLSRGEPLTDFETRLRAKNGSIKTVLITSSVVQAGEEVLHAECFTRDITELRKTQHERELLLRELQAEHARLSESLEKTRELNQSLEQRVDERTRELRETVADLNTFTYTVSHDLRAPLRSLHSFASILKEDFGGALGPEGAQYARRIVESSEQLESLTQDLLAYSRLSKPDLPVEKVEVEGLLGEVLRTMADDLSECHGRIDVTRPLASVIAQPVLLKEVLMNLISNAIKFVRKGVEPRVRIWTEAWPGGRIRLWVGDNGIGIAPEHREIIFGVFERLHSTDVYPGTGFGLAIVRRAVERMGGTVGVESSPGEGSRFWLDLSAGDGVPNQAPLRPVQGEDADS